MEKSYTWVIRSADRIYGTTNDFRVRLPYIGDLADHSEYKIGVVRCHFRKSNNYSKYVISSTNEAGATSYTFYEPPGTAYIPSEFVELHLDFGASCHGFDTAINGPRIVHFVDDTYSTRVHQSGPDDAIFYHVSTPQLTEMRVQVKNQFGKPAGQMQVSEYPAFTTDPVIDLSNHEEELEDFHFVLSVIPLKKYND